MSPDKEKEEEVDSKIGVCSYHLCGKRTTVYKCKYCGEYFCEEHIRPKPPGQPNFRSISPEDKLLMEEWHKPGGHPCPPYFDHWVAEREKEAKKLDAALDKLLRSPSYVSTSDQKDVSITLSPEMKKQKRKRYKKVRRIRRISIPFRVKFFLGSLILYLFLYFMVLPNYENEQLTIFAWIVFYALEISGLYVLLKALDGISIHSTLRLWGLRLLAAFIIGVALSIGFLYWFGMSIFIVLSPEAASALSTTLTNLAFVILVLGLLIIGGYLEFKFMEESGSIVYVR
ncbi:MAG: hypothetical protein DRN19_02830 [Thermoplasmata archaeon]|nr:MAG: hypothetical protein DRN19_02830 [Thermoplasmata archaeon]HDI72667.1 hypothetical protein [Candidatus Altiarchaeales archaeon]